MTSVPLPLHRLADFLSKGSVTVPPSPLQIHLLRGWRDSTLLSYNAGVKKFKRFLAATARDDWVLPASPTDIYDFCFWSGRSERGAEDQDVSAKTLAKYLYAIQAWHLYHDTPYPHISTGRVTVLLRACGRQDALMPRKPEKSAIMLEHLLALYHHWINGSPEETAALDCTLVAFWGMMRLAEVTYDRREGQPAWLNSILNRDVVQSTTSSNSITLIVRGAKTAKAGEAQTVLLNAQPNVLCPVQAIRRRLVSMESPDNGLFSYKLRSRVNLTRSALVRLCARVWLAHGWLGLSGHSFRVGGASFRAALGVPHQEIRNLGRWTSDCYKLYLRTYSSDALRETLSLINYLNREKATTLGNIDV